jgi:hypothetical protein
MWLLEYLINPINTQLNPTCHLLALLEAHHILHVSRIRVKETPPPKHEARDDHFFKVELCNSLLRTLLACIRSYLKSVLRYTSLIVGAFHSDTLYTFTWKKMWGSLVSFWSHKVPASKNVRKTLHSIIKMPHLLYICMFYILFYFILYLWFLGSREKANGLMLVAAPKVWGTLT